MLDRYVRPLRDHLFIRGGRPRRVSRKGPTVVACPEGPSHRWVYDMLCDEHRCACGAHLRAGVVTPGDRE